MDLISVIVPVYKVEPYLDRCVQSIVDQTYRNLEIILVDDGSPDNCGAMCDAWAQKDSRIKVIHKPNGGLSDARNAGMALATGTYIGFVDSDDYIAPEMYQLLLSRMVIDQSDIAACGVLMVFPDGSTRKLTKAGCSVLTKDEAMENIITENWLKQPVWYKLYKTDLVSDIPFPVGKYHEDVFWSYQAISRAGKVSVFDTSCYFYTQRSDSIMGASFSLNRLDAVKGKIARLDFIRAHYPSLVFLSAYDIFISCVYCGQMALKSMPTPQKTQVFSFLQETLSNISFILVAPTFHLPIKKNIWLILSKINLSATCKIRNFFHIGE